MLAHPALRQAGGRRLPRLSQGVSRLTTASPFPLTVSDMTLLAFVHYLHILTGTLWLGGSLLMLLTFFPLLARLPAAEARATYDRFAPAIGPVMGISAGLTMLLGAARAIVGGGIRGAGDIVSTYGLWVLAALALAIAAGAMNGRMRRDLLVLTERPDAFPAAAPSLVRRLATAEFAVLMALLGVMAVLGLGLY